MIVGCSKDAKENTENENVKNGEPWSIKMQKGYKPFGCCICRPSVPNCRKLGLKPGIDLSCAKVVNVVGPQTGICGRGQQKDAGLCYKNCRSGYTGVGPVCWNKSPKGFVDCGMGAAKNSKICASVTSNQVISVGFLALNVATMGGSSAAQKSTKASKFAALKKKWEAFEKTKAIKGPLRPLRELDKQTISIKLARISKRHQRQRIRHVLPLILLLF